MRTHLRNALLLSVCAIATTTLLRAAVTTVTFTSNALGSWSDGIAQDGDGGSADVPGVTLRITMISDTAGTDILEQLNFDAGTFNYLACYACNGGNGDTRGMKIGTTTGAEFQINGFNYSNWGAGSSVAMTVKGFRNNAEVASTTFNTFTGGLGYEEAVVSLGSTFDNVDEVRLYSAANSWHGINGLQIDDPVVPASVTGVTSSTANGTYKIGDTLSIQVNFTGAVGVTGTPRLTLETGAVDRAVNYTSGSGSSTLTFSYTVQSGDVATDLDYTSTAALSLNSGTIIDLNSNNATLTLPSPGAANSLGANKALVVDGVTPSVTSTAPAGTPASTDTSVGFTVNFNEAVSNISTDDFALGTTGTATGTIASVSSASGSSVTVTVNSISGSGTIKVNLNSATNIADVAGNAGPAAYSSGSTHTVAIPTAPGAPTMGTATAGNAQANVTFSAPANNGGSAITSYTATANPGGLTGSGPTSPLSVTGLTNGVSYTFTVTATNAIGTSVASSASNSVTPKAPQTITFTNPGAQTFGTSPTLSATSDSGLTVSFTSSTTGVCTITTGGQLTFVSAGTCTIDADQAGNAAFNAATTVSRSFTVNAVVPGAPSIGTATAGDTQVTVTFSAPASNGGATITSYTVTANPGGNTASGPNSALVVGGLTNGVSYTFTVTANNAVGTGTASAASNAVTPKAPQTITFTNPGAQTFGTSPTLTATATSGLTVIFTSSTTGVCTITTGGQLTFVTAGTCTINADQAGNASYLAATQVSRSFTVNAVVPGAPTTVIATGGDTQASIAFTAPANTGGSGITGYTVTVSPADVAPVNGAGTPIVVTGLTNGQAYTFTVTANNVAGTGSSSSSSNSITPKATQTITFANPAAQNFGTTPTLTATSDSGLVVAFTSATTGVCTITTGGQLTFVTTGTCTIHANQAGNAAFLAAAQVSRSFTVNAVIPGAPTIGTATAGNTQATVSFTAPASNGGSAITGYTVTANPGGASATGASSPLTVINLTNGTAYTFTVRATNAVGLGTASAASNAVTPSVPAPAASPTPSTPATPSTPTAPSTTTPSTGITDFRVTTMHGNDVTFAWTLPASGPSPTGVVIEGGSTPGSVEGSTTLPLVQGATLTLPTGVYFVRARLLTAAGAGDPSNELRVVVGELTPPSAPAGLLATVDGTTLHLLWTPTFGGGAATAGVLEVTGGMSGAIEIPAGNTFTRSEMPAGTYSITVSQKNAAGVSAPSAPVTVVVPGTCAEPPHTPRDLVAWSIDGIVHVQWLPSSSGPAPTGYALQVWGSLNATIPVSGQGVVTPAPPGTYTIAVVATNACGVSAPTATQTVVVTAP